MDLANVGMELTYLYLGKILSSFDGIDAAASFNANTSPFLVLCNFSTIHLWHPCKCACLQWSLTRCWLPCQLGYIF